jgi:hypothetical protein
MVSHLSVAQLLLRLLPSIAFLPRPPMASRRELQRAGAVAPPLDLPHLQSPISLMACSSFPPGSHLQDGCPLPSRVPTSRCGLRSPPMTCPSPPRRICHADADGAYALVFRPRWRAHMALWLGHGVRSIECDTRAGSGIGPTSAQRIYQGRTCSTLRANKGV